MNSEDIVKILRNCYITSPYFLNVYISSDLYRFKIPRTHCCFIVNDISIVEINRGVMGHFLAFYVTDNEFYFLDSFGRPLTSFSKPIVDFVERNCKRKKLIMLDKQYQSPTSCVCSIFCMFMLIGLCQRKSLDSLLKTLITVNFDVNDHFLVDWLSSSFDFTLSKRIRRQLLHCS